MNAERELTESRRQARAMAASLAKLFAAGLSITDEPDETPYEHAVLYVAAAQIKAINIAIGAEDLPVEFSGEEGVQGWCTDDKFTKTDAVAALGGVRALLRVALETIHDMRANLPSSEVTNG